MKKNLLYSISVIGLLFISYLTINSIDADRNPEQIEVKQNPTVKFTSSIHKDSNENRPNLSINDVVSMFPIACFAPGTEPSVIEDYYNKQYTIANSLGISDSDLTNSFNVTNRWSFTATDGGGLGQGDFTTLTWSYVDDGTPIPNSCNAAANDNSDFVAFFNGMYGPPATPGDYTTAPWHQIFVEMFDSWSALSGLTFVYEPNDDGAAVASSPGQLGVRGDLRISGHQVDGNSNVLACNYFPNNGDMIIDTSDSFFTNNPGTPTDPFLGTVNVLTHELGHGLGILHVCPVNETKLMEPFVSLAFDGQQEDDILAVNRSYGDREGDNDSPVNASFLGDNSGANTYRKRRLSIDDNNEMDYFSFTVDQNLDVSVILTPTGTTYLDGVQLPLGQCSLGSPFNALTVSDLMVELLDQDGVTVMETADANGPGGSEGLISSISNPGTYYIRVQQQNDVNNVQMYELELNFANCNNATVPTNLQASSITGASAFISWSVLDFAVFDLRYRENGTNTWTELNDIIPQNQTLINLMELTEYEVQVRSKCPGDTPTAYSASILFTTVGISYCDSEGLSVDGEFISNVQFATIDNPSADENGGYSDFTNISTSVIQGQDYPITITPTWTGQVFDEAYAVWIDFNQNGSFDDAGELVFSQVPTQNTPVSGLVSIPLDATLGPTRMRVSMKFDALPTSCETFDFGEVEDYTVDILDQTMSVNDDIFGSDFSLYPNPSTNGQFSIGTPNLNGKVNLEIFSMFGQQVFVKELPVIAQQVEVNAQNLSTGMYVVKLTQGNQSFSTKLNVE